MSLTLSNPAGLWALAAVPAILLVHFLQTRPRELHISTLFLLDPLVMASRGGRRWNRLRQSVPFWLQLLAAFLMALLLAGPRWVRPGATQQIVVVLDSSYSMQVSSARVASLLPGRLRLIGEDAVSTSWTLLESDPLRPVLYRGLRLDELVAAFSKWQPTLPTHDFAPVLRSAQALVRGAGRIILVTDRRLDLPEGIETLALGQPLDNCGFCGLRISADGVWHALARNYGTVAQTREWWLETAAGKTPAAALHLAPGQALELSGAFPAGSQVATLVLTADGFTVDDRLPMQLPGLKPLRVSEATGPLHESVARLLATVPALVNAADADVRVTAFDPAAPSLPDSTAIAFLAGPEKPGGILSGELVAESHELMEGLNWQGLVVEGSPAMQQRAGDSVLLWLGERPLILLRQKSAVTQLLIGIDLRFSNFLKLPAGVLLVHRFLESVRANKVAPASANFDCHEPLSLAVNPAGGEVTLTQGTQTTAWSLAQAQLLRAAAIPGFFEVRQAGVVLLHGAAQFADAREADFREAVAFDGTASSASKLTAQTRVDTLDSVWALCIAGLMLANWAWIGRRV